MLIVCRREGTTVQYFNDIFIRNRDGLKFGRVFSRVFPTYSGLQCVIWWRQICKFMNLRILNEVGGYILVILSMKMSSM